MVRVLVKLEVEISGFVFCFGTIARISIFYEVDGSNLLFLLLCLLTVANFFALALWVGIHCVQVYIPLEHPSEHYISLASYGFNNDFASDLDCIYGLDGSSSGTPAYFFSPRHLDL